MQYTIDELEEMLKEAKTKATVKVREEEKRLNALREEFLATNPYIYTTTATRKMNDWSISIPIKAKVRINRQINESTRQDFAVAHPEDAVNFLRMMQQFEEIKIVGMDYYLTEENIIHNTGGGTLLLDTPRLCSDEQWEQILSGNIPATFLSGQ